MAIRFDRLFRPAHIGAVVAALALTLAACSSTSEPTSGAASESSGGATEQTSDLPDPCSLLRDAQVNEITGKDFNSGEFNTTLSNDNQAICDWTKTVGGVDVVQVLISDADTFPANKETTTMLADVEPVSGIGQEAYITQGGGIVGVRTGDHFVQVSWLGSDSNAANTKELALEAVGNL